jgi:hypothetical protein
MAEPARNGVTSNVEPDTAAVTTVGDVFVTKYGACPPEMEYVTFWPTAKVASVGAFTMKLAGFAEPPGVPALPPPPPHAAIKIAKKLVIRRLKKRFMLRSNSKYGEAALVGAR